MAIAAATGSHLRVQQLPTLSFSRNKGPHVQQFGPPTTTKAINSSSSLTKDLSCDHLRQRRIVTRANADTLSSQEETAQLSLSPQLEDEANCREILRVLDILKEKRDMTFNEVRLTVMIEDPYEEEQREQFNVENERGCSREEMAAALVEVYEGKIPSDRAVLRALTKEMTSWPNFEDESDSPSDPTISLYARSTDTGVDPRVVAERIKVDFDKAAEIQPGEESNDINVPPVVTNERRYGD